MKDVNAMLESARRIQGMKYANAMLESARRIQGMKDTNDANPLRIWL